MSGTDSGTETTTPPAGNVSELPQWARDAITKANNEAAKYRTDLRTKTDEHTSALTQINTLSGERDTAVAAKGTAESDLLKLKVALGAGVPGDKAVQFAALLQGDTEDALKTHASELNSMFGGSTPPPATDSAQGQGSGSSQANTPEAEMAAFLQNTFQAMGYR